MATTYDESGGAPPHRQNDKLVIGASSLGTVFEWYDFFIYGTLGAILSKTFFPTGNATLEMLLFWLVFAVGFGLEVGRGLAGQPFFDSTPRRSSSSFARRLRAFSGC